MKTLTEQIEEDLKDMLHSPNPIPITISDLRSVVVTVAGLVLNEHSEICAYSFSNISYDGGDYELSISYNGWSFGSIIFRIVESEEYEF